MFCIIYNILYNIVKQSFLYVDIVIVNRTVLKFYVFLYTIGLTLMFYINMFVLKLLLINKNLNAIMFFTFSSCSFIIVFWDRQILTRKLMKITLIDKIANQSSILYQGLTYWPHIGLQLLEKGTFVVAFGYNFKEEWFPNTWLRWFLGGQICP